jgi:alcohol dehydrogenase YqhD (iron-dependent ADH family)
MMNNFIFENKTKVYFGKGGVKEYLGGLLANFGETVMLAYGGGSIKCNGVYDEIMGILNAQGKCVVEFSGIMSNPTYAKVQEGAKLARENHVDLILAVGGGSVSDCCKVISGAFDTLSHAMETYFGKPDENNLSDDINEAAMRSVIRNIRILLTDPENYDARSELAQASAMAENGVLKIGKVTDFQAHQIEHQLGAYTDCNHGAGLAVIHPVLYRHIYKSGAARFARFAQNVWASHPRAVTGKPPPVSTRWPRSLRKSVCRPALQSLAFPPTPTSAPWRILPTSPLAAAKS